MPWTSADALRHNKAATTLHLQQLWANVANSVLESTGDEARAIREANSRMDAYKAKNIKRTVPVRHR